MSKYKYNEKDVNEVIPNLWLGNLKSAYSKHFLTKYNIKYIISIFENFDTKYKFNNITYLYIPIKDKYIYSSNLIHLFNTTNDFIKSALDNNSPILVHCKRGHHRSASLVAAFLIKHKNIDYTQAITYINKLRPYSFRRDTTITKELFRYYLYLNSYTCNNIMGVSNGRLYYYICNHKY